MKLSIFCVLLLLVVCLPNSLRAQDQFVWERYTTAWVSDENEDSQDQLPISRLPSSLGKPGSGIRLIIPNKDAIFRHANGSEYIKLYLVNATADTLNVPRQDATLSGIATEVFVDGQWKILQTSSASSCGNSYWQMTMRANHFLSVELEKKTKGGITVPYRVRMKTPTFEVISNATTIQLTPALLQLAGTRPPAISG
ncbi:hypothetical protein [Fibrivirga algicola]|uniref:Uncharacterized protein n=1 Tax=Fibrivirga algicola TaxID=2950420 RepID=A0ABX0QKC1_9BACT|nr:hypothetical protein [Fibrivirga algicola]NID12552.1 hypothetical protein [Fibrivirga algicola]